MPTATGEPTKGDVNRAGQLAANFLKVVREGSEKQTEDFETFRAHDLEAALEVIDWWRKLHAKPLTSLSANLRHYVRPHGPILVTQRLKRFPTVVDKLIREPKMNLSQMADIGGCRALLPGQADVYEVAKNLRRNWDVQRTRDYAAEPKSSGYRAVHLIVRRKGRMIEVQLRTPLQDRWANQVEEDSRRVGENFKGGLGQAEVHAYYGVVSELFALRERGEQADQNLAERLSETALAASPYLAKGTSQ